MKKFQFTLNKMRNYKEQLLNEEKSKLATLNYILHQIILKIEHLEEKFAEISREMLAEQEAGITAAKLQTYEVQLTGIRHQLKQLRLDEKKAQQNVDEQMNVVLEAKQEVSKLDKLEEKQREEYDKEVAKADGIFIDELISSDLIRKEIS